MAIATGDLPENTGCPVSMYYATQPSE
jgi:hypothetical protein